MVDFAILQYYCLRCCNTYFLNVVVLKFLMLQYIIFDVTLRSFTMLQYLYSDVALHSSYIFATLHLCFVLLGTGERWERGMVEERGALGTRQRHGGRNSIALYSDLILQVRMGLGRGGSSGCISRARRCGS
jgi:hypothetical protein